ncbi:MAG: hypothetical protein IPL23_19995 [Saprospiraceae bacterium]|nr:hypothetical protein [Saprospiraceae bacterium]
MSTGKTIISICFIIFALNGSICAQELNQINNSTDELTVQRKNGGTIILKIPSKASFSKYDYWKTLLLDFQNALEKAKENIPRYEFFSISYIQGKTLKIEDSQNIITFDVKNDQNPRKKNVSALTDLKNNTILELHVSEIDELVDSSIAIEIDSAIAAIKSKKIDFLSNNRYFYDGLKNELKTNKAKVFPAMTLGGNLSFFQGKPLTEGRLGLGVIRNNRFLLLSNAFLIQYDDESKKEKLAYMLGPLFSYESFGAEFLVKISDKNELLKDLNTRLSLKYYHKLFMVSLDFYNYPELTPKFGISFGIGR